MHGIEEIDVVGLHARLNGADGNDLILVDVRTPAETARGTIQGARHIPLPMLPSPERELPYENDTAAVFYRQSGVRSARACAFMSLRGRFQAWQQAGCPRVSACASHRPIPGHSV